MKATPQGQKPRFLHLVAPEHASQVLLDPAVGAMRKIGVVAEVTSAEEMTDGSLQINFEAVRRASVVEV